MAILELEVLKVQHYTDDLFHFTVARDPGLRFRDGEFVMIGLNNWSEKLQRNKLEGEIKHYKKAFFNSLNYCACWYFPNFLHFLQM